MFYFTSDLHFYHKNIIKYAKRPFDYTDEGLLKCHQTLIDNYNSLVNENDTVFFLGDIFIINSDKKEEAISLFKKLKGYKILIKGNHDGFTKKFYKDCGFSHIFDYLILGDIFLCHYELHKRFDNLSKKELLYLELFKQNNCNLLIHGHIHNNEAYKDDDIKRINVSVDYTPNNLRPLRFEELENKIELNLQKYL